MRLTRVEGPMTIQPNGIHSCRVTCCGIVWTATDTELRLLAIEIANVLNSKHTTTRNENP